MADLQTLLAFAAAALVFAYVPGPAILYVAAFTMARGKSQATFATLGLHAGGYVYVFGAACGLASLFTYVPTAFVALKLAGAAYLIYLGWKMLTSTRGPERVSDAIAMSPRRAFAQGFIIEVTNPKAALFFVAFLPQFIDPAASLPVTIQFLILGTIVNLLFLSADIFYVLSADFFTRRAVRSSSALRMAQRLGGVIMISLGARLALTRT